MPRFIQTTHTVTVTNRAPFPDAYQGMTIEQALDWEHTMPESDKIELIANALETDGVTVVTEALVVETDG